MDFLTESFFDRIIEEKISGMRISFQGSSKMVAGFQGAFLAVITTSGIRPSRARSLLVSRDCPRRM
jgi:hypothetical protein